MGAAYQDALGWLYRLEPRGIRLGVERVREALKLRGNPDSFYRIVQVAGTNGKGSTAAMIERVLRASGHRVGLYTSPHLHGYGERMRVQGRPAGRAELVRRVRELRGFVDDPQTPWLTFFEVSLMMACERFRDAGCDVVVLEVGLGGRLDATTAASADVSVITEIDLDHRHRLGSTIPAIAREKAGIIRAKTPVVIGASRPEARRVIGARARRLGAERYYQGRDFGWREPGEIWCGESRFSSLTLGLAGDHQRGNAAVAVQAARLVDSELDVKAVRNGLRLTSWPGRLESIPGAPRFLLDAAHNPAGCEALATYLKGQAREGRRVLLFGAMADKEIHRMLPTLVKQVDRVIFAVPDMHRAADPRELAATYGGRAARSVETGLSMAKRAAGGDGEVIVAGSIFLLAEVRARVLGILSDPPIPM